MHYLYGAYHYEGGMLDIGQFMKYNLCLLLNNVFEGIVQIGVECDRSPVPEGKDPAMAAITISPGETYEILINTEAIERILLQSNLMYAKESKIEALWQIIFAAVRTTYQELWLERFKDQYVRKTGCKNDEKMHTVDIGFTVVYARRVLRKGQETKTFDLKALTKAVSITASEVEQSEVDSCIIEYGEMMEAYASTLN
jgi:hypothetical protein